jgi:hypothetical protein
VNIPSVIRAGDILSWDDEPVVDATGALRSSVDYTLTYVIAGPTAKFSLTGAPNGAGWRTSLDSVSSDALIAGTYAWQAVLTATGFRTTVGGGTITVLTNLAALPSGATYDGRSRARKAFEEAEAALATYTSTGGAVKSFTINGRSVTYTDVSELTAIVNYWRARVITEDAQANGGGGRAILTRFTRAR